MPFALAMTLSSTIGARAATDNGEVGLRYSAESWLDCTYDFYEPEIATYQLESFVSTFYSQGMKHEAARHLADLRARDPYLADVNQAWCDRWAGEFAQAEALLSAAILAEPNRPDAFRERSYLRLAAKDEQGYYADLNGLIERLKVTDHEYPDRCFERARLLFEWTNYSEAAAGASEAIEAHITMWDDFIIRIARTKDFERYRRPPAWYYYLRAASYLKLGRYKEAIADYGVCESQDWISSQLLNERAECYAKLGDEARAAADRRRADVLAAEEQKTEVQKPKEAGAEKIQVVDPTRSEPKLIDPIDSKPLKPDKTAALIRENSRIAAHVRLGSRRGAKTRR
jgi:tetratricopeptide (TPR) repeat protein